jgi:hypothetical protein
MWLVDKATYHSEYIKRWISSIGCSNYYWICFRCIFQNYATTGALSSGLSGKISTGGAASDVNSYSTTISGGEKLTGSIQSTTCLDQ